MIVSGCLHRCNLLPASAESTVPRVHLEGPDGAGGHNETRTNANSEFAVRATASRLEGGLQKDHPLKVIYPFLEEFSGLRSQLLRCSWILAG
jgi:hypothetical protein